MADDAKWTAMLWSCQTRWAVLALALITCGATADDNTSELPTYSSTVSEVRVTFFATDETNHAVATLTKTDFAVVDNEQVVRNFRSFAHSEETSLEIVILVDTSQSVESRLQLTKGDVTRLLERERSVPEDVISILSFGGTSATPTKDGLVTQFAGLRPAVLCSGGCQTSDSITKLTAVRSTGTTPLFDALIFGADFTLHHRRAGVRPVLILFSDGNDNISLHSSRDALREVTAAGALIYSIDIGNPKKQTSGSAYLQQLSEATGGRYFSLRPSRQENASTVLSAVLDDLRASYVVTYDLPSHRVGFHSLRLLPTNNLNFTFHSRNGYFYEPSLR